MRSRYTELFKNLNVQITEYDFDDDFEEIRPLNIGAILPVVIFINNHQEVLRIIGEKSKKELLKLTEGLKNI
jgi:hypothetical protein